MNPKPKTGKSTTMKIQYNSRSFLAAMTAVIIASSVGCGRSAEPEPGGAAPALPEGGQTYDFENGNAGRVPTGFTAALLGGGGPVRWEVEEIDAAPSGKKVVAQLSGDKTNTRYPLLVRNDFSARDVDLSVKFRTLSGEVDASGGIVFRYLDKNNFYVVRANSLEGNVVAYKTENGKRSNIGVKGKDDAYGVKAVVPHEKWNNLRVIARGRHFEIYLNGRMIFEVEDDTFTKPGKVGLWTKADAVTRFDDLAVAALDK